MRDVRENNVAVESNMTKLIVAFRNFAKAPNMYYTFWLCICSLSYPANNAMRRIILSSVAYLVPPYFCTLSHNDIVFAKKKKKKVSNTTYLFWFSLKLLPETFLILRRTLCNIVINVKMSWNKYPPFLSDFNETWIFSTDFRKKLKYQISWKSVQWEPSSVQTDGHDEANRRF